MRYEIRAMSFGEILDMSFRLVRDHFIVLVGIASVIYVPLAVLGAGIAPSPTRAAAPFPIVSIIGILVLALVGTPIVWAAVTVAIRSVYLGQPASIGGALRSGLSLSLPLVGT